MILLTGCDFDVGAGPKLLRVAVLFSADAAVQHYPVRFIGAALTRPGWRVELVVPDMLAMISSVFHSVPGGGGNERVEEGLRSMHDKKTRNPNYFYIL